MTTKLETTMQQHPEMDPIEITRIEVKKVAEPTLRAGLEAIVNLIELASTEFAHAAEGLAQRIDALDGTVLRAPVAPTDPAPPAETTTATT